MTSSKSYICMGIDGTSAEALCFSAFAICALYSSLHSAAVNSSGVSSSINCQFSWRAGAARVAPLKRNTVGAIIGLPKRHLKIVVSGLRQARAAEARSFSRCEINLVSHADCGLR